MHACIMTMHHAGLRLYVARVTGVLQARAVLRTRSLRARTRVPLPPRASYARRHHTQGRAHIHTHVLRVHHHALPCGCHTCARLHAYMHARRRMPQACGLKQAGNFYPFLPLEPAPPPALAAASLASFSRRRASSASSSRASSSRAAHTQTRTHHMVWLAVGTGRVIRPTGRAAHESTTHSMTARTRAHARTHARTHHTHTRARTCSAHPRTYARRAPLLGLYVPPPRLHRAVVAGPLACGKAAGVVPACMHACRPHVAMPCARVVVLSEAKQVRTSHITSHHTTASRALLSHTAYMCTAQSVPHPDTPPTNPASQSLPLTLSADEGCAASCHPRRRRR